MTGRSSRFIFVTKNELIPKIPYHRKAHDFHFSVRSSAGRAKMWEWYDQHDLTLFKRTKKNNKKKTSKRSELIAKWMRSKRRIVQTYLVLARHLISYWAKKWTYIIWYFEEPIIWCLWTTSKILVTENVLSNPAFSDTDHLSIKLQK